MRTYGFIDYENKVRSCNNCHQIKPFHDFSIISRANPRPMSNCKICRSRSISNKEMEKRLEKEPHLYYQCDYCDKIFKRFRKTNGNSKIIKLDNCLFCRGKI